MIKKAIVFGSLFVALFSPVVFAGTPEDSAIAYMKTNNWKPIKIIEIVNNLLIIEIPPFQKKTSMEEPPLSHFTEDKYYWADVDTFGELRFIIDKYGKKFDTIFLKQKKIKEE